jgi:hypothetical protein
LEQRHREHASKLRSFKSGQLVNKAIGGTRVTIGTEAQTQAKLSINHKYYSNNDELVKRLTLLCWTIEVGNNSIEVKNEIASILDTLLNSKVINSKENKMLFNKWCN